MRLLAFAIVSILQMTFAASAQVFETTNRSLWENSGGSYTSITFTDLPNFTVVTTQYSSFGLTFSDGNDFVHTTTAYSDGHGLVSSDGFGNPGTIHMSFTEPTYWLGIDFIGALRVNLYNNGQLVYAGQPHFAGFGPFLGFVSTQPFDQAIAWDFQDDVVAIDNIHFGPPVPGPAAPAALLAALLIGSSRRRRSGD